MELRRRQLNVSALLISFVALLVSMCASREATRAHEDSQEESAVSHAYTAFEEMNKFQLDHPEIAHLLTNKADYDHTVADVRKAVGPLTEQQRAQYLLIESATAFYIFSEVDRLVTAEAQAKRLHIHGRRRFLDATLHFYSNVLLPNPRLAYYWYKQKGSAYYPAELDAFFRNEVWGGREPQWIDPIGPFGAVGTAEAEAVGAR